MARWFGPSGNCGCCQQVIPCDCIEGGDCVPIDPGYYRNMAVEISEVPNEIYQIATGIDRACNTRTCRPTENLTRLTDRRYTGFAAINGTYPISFFQYDADLDEYVEADPRSGCGFWGAEDMTFDIDYQEIQFSEFNFVGSSPPCNAIDITGNATLSLTWNPFANGFVEPSYPVVLTNFPSPNRAEPLLPRFTGGTIERTRTFKLAGCRGGGETVITENINTNDPLIDRDGIAGALVQASLAPFMRVNVPGLFIGMPKTPPPGFTMVNSRYCRLNVVEYYTQYEEKTFVTLNTPGNCGRYADLTFGGWQIRRKLVFT